jgi:hypothetical protein
MILSDKALLDRTFQTKEEAEEAIELWKNSKWDEIGNRIVILPFDTDALGPCCYDLSVGNEYVSLRDPHNTKYLRKGEHFQISPGETVLILS